jgi:pilus assembly protein CpaD
MRNTLRSGTLRASLGGTAVMLCAALSAGCSSVTPNSTNPRLAYDSEVRHPILISNEPETLDLPVGMHGPALSPQIETAIRTYVKGYRATGTGGITIQVPTDAANEIAAASTGRAVHYALVRAGVPRGRIQVAPYPVGDHSRPATLRLSYLKVKAVTPSCGLWPETQPNTIENPQYENFGCAAQQNLAAMVANPADLVQPEPMTPPNGTRRSSVIRTYANIGNTGWNPEPRTDLTESSIGGQ